jgi:AraC-like DNA-binding protein
MWGQEFIEHTLYDKVYVITRGGGTLNLNETIYQLKPGMAFLFQAGLIQTGSVDPALGLEVTWIHFQARTGSGHHLLDVVPMPRCVQGSAAARVKGLMEELLKEWNGARPGSPLAIKSLLPRIMLEFCRCSPSDLHLPDTIRRRKEVAELSANRASRLPQIAAALRLIDTDYARPLTLPELAASTHLSPAYFCTLFQALTGLTPMRHLERRRILRAMELIRQGGSPLHCIARDVGYHDPYHFSRVFRRVTRISPSQYRQSNHSA